MSELLQNEEIETKPRFNTDENRVEFFPEKWPQQHKETLLWFFEHGRKERFNLKAYGQAVSYDTSTISRVANGIYNGSYENFCEAIHGYKKIVRNRLKIQNADFVPNRNTTLIHNACDYALASNTITLISGESGTSKTSSLETFCAKRENQKRSFLIDPSEIAPAEGLIKHLARLFDIPTKDSALNLRNAIHEKVTSDMIIMVDECGFLLPTDRKEVPVGLEFLRRLHDKKKCAVALVATARFGSDLQKLEYQFEQVLGRIGLPVRLHSNFEEAEVRGIVEQYIPRPSEKVMDQCMEIASEKKDSFQGRLRSLVELLRLASRIAAKDDCRVTEATFMKALNTRKQMMGSFVYAAKQ